MIYLIPKIKKDYPGKQVCLKIQEAIVGSILTLDPSSYSHGDNAAFDGL